MILWFPKQNSPNKSHFWTLVARLLPQVPKFLVGHLHPALGGSDSFGSFPMCFQSLHLKYFQIYFFCGNSLLEYFERRPGQPWECHWNEAEDWEFGIVWCCCLSHCTSGGFLSITGDFLSLKKIMEYLIYLARPQPPPRWPCLYWQWHRAALEDFLAVDLFL